jgi:hypothetical protein
VATTEVGCEGGALALMWPLPAGISSEPDPTTTDEAAADEPAADAAGMDALNAAGSVGDASVG